MYLKNIMEYLLPNIEVLKDKKMENVKHWMGKLQVMIAVSFTIIAVISMLGMGIILYSSYTRNSKQQIIEDNIQLMNQVELNLTNYLRNMMRISDTLYYTVIKDTDFSKEKVDKELAILYEANKDTLVSLACFTQEGELICATPVNTPKPNLDLSKQDWFQQAKNRPENLHFSASHVQNIFVDSNHRYYWVISLSRGIEITKKGSTAAGILLVDMNFSGIQQLFSKVNNNGMAYFYLMDQKGEIIYHPKQNLIFSDLYEENNQVAITYEDGTKEERFNNKERIINVKTVGYTGWKIVSVIPKENLHENWTKMNLIWITVLGAAILILIYINQSLSTKITEPIRRLEQSVKEMKLEQPECIYVGGSQEIRHLGKTIRSMVEQMKQLMDDMVRQQEEKRKNELDALQSQINPHFLYNTLDSIIWMVESQRYEEAISMVSSLANLFRISLSQGKAIISIEEEFRHAIHYIKIQKVRYKNKFTVAFHLEDEIKDCLTIKLILQPLLENAIYYGMEAMDGDGEILVQGYKKEEEIILEVIDNGMGMPKEKVEHLLTDGVYERKHGSGIGLKNVDQRIKLYFGNEYGLIIKSEPDVGTHVTIRLPIKKEIDHHEAGR